MAARKKAPKRKKAAGKRRPGGPTKRRAPRRRGVVTIYQDAKKRWRWVVEASNGNLVAREAEGDGYRSASAAARAYCSAKEIMNSIIVGRILKG